MPLYQEVIKELFYILTSALVIFCALELVWPGIVLSYININWVLIFWLIAGIVMVSLKNNFDNTNA